MTDLPPEAILPPAPLAVEPCKCGAPANEPAPCPYADDVHGNTGNLCNCCDDCARECALDI